MDRCWVVDPIDGTHNFLRGVPYWNVAIGYVENGRTRDRRGLRSAGRRAVPRAARRTARGASDREGDDAPPRGRDAARWPAAYVVLGHHDRAFEPRYFDIRRRMMEAGVAMRNFGSGALQLAHVASGRLDGFIELQLSAWDAVAGLLLVEEAGGYHAPFAPADADGEGAVRRVRAGHRRRR